MSTPQSAIRLVEMNGTFGNADLDDGVHPTRAGADKMADEWLSCIQDLQLGATPGDD